MSGGFNEGVMILEGPAPRSLIYFTQRRMKDSYTLFLSSLHERTPQYAKQEKRALHFFLLINIDSSS